jgi:hypothetical protein
MDEIIGYLVLSLVGTLMLVAACAFFHWLGQKVCVDGILLNNVNARRSLCCSATGYAFAWAGGLLFVILWKSVGPRLQSQGIDPTMSGHIRDCLALVVINVAGVVGMLIARRRQSRA